MTADALPQDPAPKAPPTRQSAGGQPSWLLSRWLFLRLLGIVYLIAFVSLWTQVHGLIGERGILPAADYLQRAAAQLGPERLWLLPTVGWLGAGDAALTRLCAAGTAASVLLVVGIAPAIALALLWALYLSLVVLGQDFLSFQWDLLLLEAGFLAIFLAPKRPLLPGLSREPPVSRLAHGLLRWLLLRFMIMSGGVKLISGDAAWHNLTALTFHYQTQPLPVWTSWYAHQLPVWFHKLSCAGMFVIELAAPLLIFARRRLRHLACALLVGLQLLIAATGSYTFFNLLTIALCVLLLDDELLVRRVPKRWRQRVSERAPAPAAVLASPRQGVVLAGAAVLLLLSGLQTARTLGLADALSSPVDGMLAAVAPLRTINGYGLFAVMTTQRPEIVIEGSNDGQTWKPYEFRWKPGDLTRRPRLVAPHQPRLDWQMWFAALSTFRREPWLAGLLRRLLEGEPQVLRLLARDPFQGTPPRYVRAQLYDYRFTDAQTRRATGQWWRRELLGPYSPVLSLPRG